MTGKLNTGSGLAVDGVSAGSALVRSLRNCCAYAPEYTPTYDLTNEAADRIEELEYALRGALANAQIGRVATKEYQMKWMQILSQNK